MWNELLSFVKFCYKEYDRFPTKRTLLEMAKNSGLYSQTSQTIANRVEDAIWRFVKRRKTDQKAGFPRFKPFNRMKSLSYPQLGFRLIDRRHLKVAPFGLLHLRGYKTLPAGTI